MDRRRAKSRKRRGTGHVPHFSHNSDFEFSPPLIVTLSFSVEHPDHNPEGKRDEGKERRKENGP